MYKTLIRETKAEDAAYLAPRLRAIDIEEIIATGYTNALEALEEGAATPMCWTALSPTTGEPIAMFGVVLLADNDFNTIWLLGTDEIEKHARLFTRTCRAWITAFAYAYAPLGNFLLKHNHTHRKWLEACGFKEERRVVGENGAELIFYIRRRD